MFQVDSRTRTHPQPLPGSADCALPRAGRQSSSKRVSHGSEAQAGLCPALPPNCWGRLLAIVPCRGGRCSDSESTTASSQSVPGPRTGGTSFLCSLPEAGIAWWLPPQSATDRNGVEGEGGWCQLSHCLKLSSSYPVSLLDPCGGGGEGYGICRGTL